MSSVTLYRKYRPQNFDEIVNQDHVKSTIRHELLSGQMPHAFLFHGPRGVGKTTMARVLAKALNCKKRDQNEADPCGECESCQAITQGTFLNLIEIDAASQTQVDKVRENIIANSRVAVKGDEYKIFIIDEVHMLSGASFNALLKTLEEPPERVSFILATTEIHKIPATILSRCQRFDFHPIDGEALKNHLKKIVEKEGRVVADEVLATIAKKSAGHVRDAMSLLGQVLSLSGDITPESASFILPISQTEEVLSFYRGLSEGRLADIMIQLQELEKKGFRALQFCQDLMDFAHKLLLFRVGSHPDIFEGEVAGEQLEEIKSIAGHHTPATILAMLDILIKRFSQLKDYDQGKLPLELAAVEIAELSSSPQKKTSPETKPVAPMPQTEAPKDRQMSQRQQPKPAPAPTNGSSAPVEPVAEKKIVDSKEKAAPVIEVSQLSGELATYDDVQGIWQDFLAELSNASHSVFIVLRTGVLRATSEGGPEIALRFQMHHDHVKRNLDTVNQAAQKILEKRVEFSLAVDAALSADSQDEVAEPDEDEKEALGEELNQLAEAFGGSVMD